MGGQGLAARAALALAAASAAAPATAARVAVNLTCGARGPAYGVDLNGAPVFAAPPPFQLVSGGSWQTDFVLLRAQPEAGTDAIGAYAGVACTYASAASPSEPLVVLEAVTYAATSASATSSAVRFTYEFPRGVADTAVAPPHPPADDDAAPPTSFGTVALYPAFTAPIPPGQPSSVLTWSGSFMQASYAFSDALGMAGGPVLFYNGADVAGDALLLSPLDQPLSSSLGNEMGGAAPPCNASAPGGAGCWAAGVSSTFTSLPPGFRGSWLLLAEAGGVTPTVAAYRSLLLSYYASTAQKLPDVSITGLSYTTDNGGQLTFGCPNQVLDSCLLGEAEYLRTISAPIQMLSFQNAPMVARGESAPWCVSEFVPNPRKVPMGIQAFQAALGLPLQLYAPYLCNTTDYVSNFTLIRSNPALPGCAAYDFYNPAPAHSLEYFSFIMDLVLDYGATLFEPDFLHQNHLCMDETTQVVGAAEALFGGMATAAAERGIAIQFCFATPHVMLWTLTAPAVTNARVSYDFFYGNSWDIGSSSLLAWAVNSAPSKDTLWSSDNGAQATTRGGCAKTGCPPDHSAAGAVLHTVLATLSTGPVGYSDAPNETDITLVMRTCDAAGNLLQPSRPVVAVDSTHDVTPGAAPTGYVLATHTTVPTGDGADASPAMYYVVSHHLKAPFALRSLDVYPRLAPGNWYALANWTALQGCADGTSAGACSVELVAAPPTLGATVAKLQPQADPFLPLLTLVAPLCGGSGGTAFFGEVDKVTAVSVQRFPTLRCADAAQGEVAFNLVGQPGETVRLAYAAGGRLLYLAVAFPAGQAPVTVACTLGAAVAGCSLPGVDAGVVPQQASAPHQPPAAAAVPPRAGSGPAAVAGAIARASTPVKETLLGPLRGALPDALVDYVEKLHAKLASGVRPPRPPPPVAASDPLLAPLAELLAAAEAGVDPVAATQDCMAYGVAYEYALRVMPARAPHREVWDALRLGPDCGAPPPPSREELGLPPPWPPAATDAAPSAGGPTFYVSPTGSDTTGDGSLAAPFATVRRGVDATRAARPPGAGPASVILRAGLHVLGDTVALDARDAGLTIANYPGEAAWVSGGAPVSPAVWTPYNVTANASNVYAAALGPSAPRYLTSLVTVNATDGSPGKRLYRAQLPNFNPELSLLGACGGGPRAARMPECVRAALESPFITHTARRLAAAAGGGAAGVSHPWAAAGSPVGVVDGLLAAWLPPPHFPTPQLVFRDLSGLGLKNDSILAHYNQFAVGRGGACGLWTDAWPANSSLGWDYHCGNISAGGWEEVDELMYTIGQLNLPAAAVLNLSAYPHAADWAPDVDPAHRVNGAAVVNAWHTQSWFNNAFYVTGATVLNASALLLNMSADGVYPLGGWQGGRHWQTNGSFHGGTPDGPLLGGPWWVSNLFAELDAYDEYYYDVGSGTLYVFWNTSADAGSGGDPFGPPPAGLTLMAPQLEVFFDIRGTSDVTLSGLGFRDQRGTMLEPWTVPSGGDWGLRPAGAVNVWDSERVTVTGGLFSRTDGNAVFLGGYVRNASVLDTEFVWIGMSAVASLGLTDFDDGTAGEQPWGTVMAGLYVHELALVQKQSSAYFSGRTPLARLESSLMFNGPRAMININDDYGGGSNFTRNLLFNTCRESGDHGNMNSWSRLALGSNITGGGPEPVYMGQLKMETSLSLGIGNYGASQVFDNDDGSAGFFTHHNFFYQSDGFKGDYGAHSSIFESNVVVSRPYDGQNCINTVPFVPGYEHVIVNNTCVVMGARAPSGVDVVMQGAGGWCTPDNGDGLLVARNNAYYTQHGNASVLCGPSPYGTPVTAWRAAHPAFEAGSTVATLPTPDAVIAWGRGVLGL